MQYNKSKAGIRLEDDLRDNLNLNSNESNSHESTYVNNIDVDLLNDEFDEKVF